jgi:hypothetical protein
MWKYIAIALLLLTGPETRASQPLQQDQSAIVVKMTELAGPHAVSCGLVDLAHPFEAAWECAQAADRRSKPFWLAAEGHRTDSAVWLAIARNASGKRYVVFYTSNESGQQSFEPSFNVTPCLEPFQLVRKSLFFLRCGPDVP